MLSIKIVQISIMFQRNISKLVLFIMLIWNVISLYLAICIQMQSLLQSEEIFGPILANSRFLRSHFALFILNCARNNSDPIQRCCVWSVFAVPTITSSSPANLHKLQCLYLLNVPTQNISTDLRSELIYNIATLS